MGKLESDDSPISEQSFQSQDETRQIGNVGQHVVTNQKVGSLPFPGQVTTGFFTEKAYKRRNALTDRDFRHIFRRLNS